MTRPLRFLRRGRRIELDRFDPRMTLLDWIRLEERSVGTKEGCNEGDCGACTVALGRIEHGHLVYRPVNACILLLGQIDGADLVTVEDLSREGLHPVQAAMVKHHGSQCGFCTPGIVMSLFTLYQDAARPVTRAQVQDQLAGNLCRCTGYRPIIDAALEACAEPAADSFAAEAGAVAAELAALDDPADMFAGDETRFFAGPASVASALVLLQRHPDAAILAGATDAGLWITKRLMDLPKIVWLGRISELRTVSEDAETLTLGAMVTHRDALPALARLDPDLGELLRRFGSAQVRASGTVGGNIANGSPIGDLAPALIALDASLTLESAAGERTIPLERFFIAYGKQDRAAGELVTSVSIPKLKAHQAFRAYKLTKRFDEDISAVMGAFRFEVAEGKIVSARIAYGGMAATPKRADRAEAALAGASLDLPADWQPALAALGDDFHPISDMRASAGYRLKGAQALLARALREIAAGDDAATRLIGRRQAMEAAE